MKKKVNKWKIALIIFAICTVGAVGYGIYVFGAGLEIFGEILK